MKIWKYNSLTFLDQGEAKLKKEKEISLNQVIQLRRPNIIEVLVPIPYLSLLKVN